jgi:hypothetical protein
VCQPAIVAIFMIADDVVAVFSASFTSSLTAAASAAAWCFCGGCCCCCWRFFPYCSLYALIIVSA